MGQQELRQDERSPLHQLLRDPFEWGGPPFEHGYRRGSDDGRHSGYHATLVSTGDATANA